MKKIYFSLAMMCGLCCLSGCTNDLEQNVTSGVVNGEQLTIHVGMLAEKSRISYDDTQLKLAWEENDQLVLVGFDANGKYVNHTFFNLLSGTGEMSATFTGSAIEGATQYRVYYQNKQLFISAHTGTATFSYDGQVQRGNHSTAHLKDYLYLQSDLIDASELASGNITLHMQNSLIRLNLKNLPESIQTVNSLVWLNNGGTDAAKVTTLSFRQLEQGDITAFMSFDPTSMTLQKGGNFEIQLFSDNNIYRRTITSNQGKVYRAGARSVATLDSDWVEVQRPTDEIWVMSSSNENLTKEGLTCSSTQNGYGYYTIHKEGTDELNTLPAGFFKSNMDITRVILPSTITTIGDYALASPTLESVLLPENLNSIGDGAFNACAKLTTLAFPTSLSSIGSTAFSACKALTSVDLSATNVTLLPINTFKDCIQLTSVKLPEGLTSLGSKVFSGCEQLTSIEFPSSVNELKNSAFYYCTNLRRVVVKSMKLKFSTDEFSFIFEHTPSNAELFLNVALKNQVKNRNKWAGKTWKSITYIDEKGTIVED